MKTNIIKKVLLISFFSLLLLSCEKENQDILIGKWEFVQGFNSMSGYYIPGIQASRIEEYTKDNIRIRYDFEGNEISRCNYIATNSTFTISGKELNGETWSLDYNYWFVHDTLKLRNDGGFEYYDEFFIRIN